MDVRAHNILVLLAHPILVCCDILVLRVHNILVSVLTLRWYSVVLTPSGYSAVAPCLVLRAHPALGHSLLSNLGTPLTPSWNSVLLPRPLFFALLNMIKIYI